jgi:hypothetical protein
MRTWLTLVGALLLPAAAGAQMVGDKEITPQVGWQWGGTQEYSNYVGYPAGDFHSNAALNYGGTLSIYIRDYYAAEISYSYQSTDLILRPNGQIETSLGTMASQYMQLQGLRVLPVKPDKVDVIGIGGLGAAVFSAEGFDSRWLFAMTAGIGAKFHMNEKTSLRLQSRLLLPIQWGESGFYFGTGGSGISVGGGSTLVQGDVSLGLSMKLGS